MKNNQKRNLYKYDFRYMDDLTETKDLKKSIIINIIILAAFFILYVAGFTCGVILIPKKGLVEFIIMFSMIGVMEVIVYILCIRTIVRAFKKIEKNKCVLIEKKDTPQEK